MNNNHIEHQQLHEYLKNLAFKYGKKEYQEQIFWYFEDVIDNEVEIEKLEEIRKEHSIMKQFIYENGLWEKFLNDDRFMKHLRSDE